MCCGNVISVVGDSPRLFTHNWLLHLLSYMGLLEVIRFCFDAIVRNSLSADLSGRFDIEPGASDVMQQDSGGIAMTTSVQLWGGDYEPYDWLHVLSQGAGLMAPPIGGCVVFFWSEEISYISGMCTLGGNQLVSCR